MPTPQANPPQANPPQTKPPCRESLCEKSKTVEELILLRLATEKDSKEIWEWRNDEKTRSASLNQETIDWKTHQLWYQKISSDPHFVLYIGSLESKKKIGVCRFDIQKEAANVSIHLNPAARGKRLCHRFLQAAIENFRTRHALALRCTIRKENLCSINCFSRAGFLLESSESLYNHYTYSPLLALSPSPLS